MKRSSNFVSALLGLMLLVVLGIGLAAVLRGASSATSGPGVSPLATAVTLQSPLSAPTPVSTPSPAPTATPLVIPPPPNWPTDQPWPPTPAMAATLPTAIPQPFPMPDFQPTPKGARPNTLQSIWYPYFPDPASSPRLVAELVDQTGQRWGRREHSIDLTIDSYNLGGPSLDNLITSPNHQLIFAHYSFLPGSLVDLTTGVSRPIVTDPNAGPGELLAWAPDGQRALIVPSTPEIWEINVNSQHHQVVDFPQSEVGRSLIRAATYLPDGITIVDASVYGRTPSRSTPEIEIGLQVLGQGERSTITRIAGGDRVIPYSLISSPDGTKLICVIDVLRDARYTELWLIDIAAKTSKSLVQLAKGLEYTHPAAWSPDGRYVAVLKAEKGSPADEKPFTNIYLLDLETGQQQQLTHFTNRRLSHLIWSPAGQTLAFTINTNDHSEVWVIGLTGVDPHPVAGPSIPNAPSVWLP